MENIRKKTVIATWKMTLHQKRYLFPPQFTISIIFFGWYSHHRHFSAGPHYIYNNKIYIQHKSKHFVIFQFSFRKLLQVFLKMNATKLVKFPLHFFPSLNLTYQNTYLHISRFHIHYKTDRKENNYVRLELSCYVAYCEIPPTLIILLKKFT